MQPPLTSKPMLTTPHLSFFADVAARTAMPAPPAIVTSPGQK
jgi:hypothetical protein